MGDIAQRGNKLTKRKGPHGHASQPHLSVHAKGGRAGHFGGGRTNLLEELGRVEAEPSNRNRRAEIARVHGELNRGYNKGGRVGLKHGGKPWGAGPKPGTLEHFQHTTQTPKRKRKAGGGVARGAQKAADTFIERAGGSEKGKPHSTKEGRTASGKRKITRFLQRHAEKYKNPKRKFPPDAPTWSNMPRKPLEKPKFQPLKKGGKADKNWIQKAVNPKHKGFCTPMTKKTCTPRRKALARTFKKKAKTGW